MAEIEREPAVGARLADRLRLDRIDGDVLEPTRVEDQHGLLEVSSRRDAEASLVEQAAPDARRRRDG
jgi:hypothetical protein